MARRQSRDNVVRQVWGPVNAVLSHSRLLRDQRASSFLLPKGTALLSLDVAGVALRRAVLSPQDVHRLVESTLARGHPQLSGRYLALRLQAEQRARAQATGAGRQEIAMANVADHLKDLLAYHALVNEPGEVARQAVRHELELEQIVCSGNPEAVHLHDEAIKRGIPVAFVADSYLPRDFVNRMLQAAQFRPDYLLVSSHEGLTKRSGLFERLAQISNVAPSAIVHIGPSEELDVAKPQSLGMRAFRCPGDTHESEDLVGPTQFDRSGIDSIALTLANDRLQALEGGEASSTDIGYYAGGPLAAGFATWIGQLIEADQPHRVLFCGPSGELLRRVTAILHPELPDDLLAVFLDPRPSRFGVSHLAALEASLQAADGDRVLVIDVGWTSPSHRLVQLETNAAGRSLQVSGAYLGLVEGSTNNADTHTWAFDADHGNLVRNRAIRQLEILEALLHSGLWAVASDQSRQIADGVLLFAQDFEPWLGLGDRHVTAALLEPALRIITSPRYSEAVVLGPYPASAPGPDGRPSALASLPPRVEVARNPSLVEARGRTAPWAAGYRALADGADPPLSTRRTKRPKKRRRPHDHDGDQPL